MIPSLGPQVEQKGALLELPAELTSSGLTKCSRQDSRVMALLTGLDLADLRPPAVPCSSGVVGIPKLKQRKSSGFAESVVEYGQPLH